jgi:hypothetical protein
MHGGPSEEHKGKHHLTVAGLAEGLRRWQRMAPQGEERVDGGPRRRRHEEKQALLAGLGLLTFSTGGRSELTEQGRQFIEVAAHLRASSEEVPDYDQVARVLRWRGEVVKRLRREAASQEAVLRAFQLAGWPERIDDPLEADPVLDRKERLRETVKSLNKGMAPGTICFHADGTGQGFRWESV